ncbi:Crp/Fnr family transcriptional regulator [Virgibacillus sp. W0181]|uniref:Crp/Fnr family transcriptional regulator n=1 Tax=Virgibacillus sp. W0181 TaxID=3391581 RepID=UPI003F44992C
MKDQSIQNFLQQFPIFKNLTDYEMQPILDIAKSRTYHIGSHIFMQGNPLTNVYFIHRGKIKIYKTDFHGKEQIVNVLQDGDMFPHQGFFKQGSYPAHAQVIEKDAMLIHIPIPSFENFLITHPEICIKLFRVLSEIISDLQKRLEEQILHNVYEQIVLLLIRLGKKHGEPISEQETRIMTQFTNRELANMIGSSRETVSRTLTQLKKQQLIKTDINGYIIISHEDLEDEVL